MFAALTVIGNLGKDAVEKNGWIVFSVGCKPSMKGETLWLTVRTKMQWCASLTKGTRVLAQGTPAFDVFNGKVSGTIFANNVVNLSPRVTAEGESMPNIPAPEYAPAVDDDVPF